MGSKPRPEFIYRRLLVSAYAYGSCVGAHLILRGSVCSEGKHNIVVGMNELMHSKCTTGVQELTPLLTYSEDGVHFLIMRCKPGYERKRTQADPDEVGEPEDDERKDSEVCEELVPCHDPAISRCAILRLMQSSEQNCRGECRRPDECARVY
jgi:hypothetical protein